MSSAVSTVAPGVFRIEDTCAVYVVAGAQLPDGTRTALAVDFGSGDALDHLADLGIDRITDVLMTHHHRDQAQGLPRALAHGARIHVPPVEQDLFAKVDEFWRMRPIWNDYVLRQDKFSLLDPVPVETVPEYRTREYAGVPVEVIPTPGHSTGSVTYLLARDGRTLAFTGDLVYAPGKVWSLAATQWSYSENEGPAMTVLSCYQLLERELDLLLPSHGPVMTEPHAALELLARRMQEYINSRRQQPWDLRARLVEPFRPLTEHFLFNQTSNACSYVLVSRTGAALVFDYGYDLTTGWPPGADRASRRPWLATLPALRGLGVGPVEVVVPTHYHDDHVAGMNLLREVEGTEVWAPANVAPIFEHPLRLDLPCTWYDPIPVDRVLPLGESFSWHEYEITVHELPGHTLYAVAYEFVVDGVKVMVTGDQQDGAGVRGEQRELLNYQYRNGFRIEDFRRSAALYKRVRPDLMVSGHWQPRWVDAEYFDLLEDGGEEVVRIHRDLLPLDEHDLGAGGIVARLTPYFCEAHIGDVARFSVTVHNPYAEEKTARLQLVTPPEWLRPDEVAVPVPGAGEIVVELVTEVRGPAMPRARVAVDLTIGELRLGQHVEALVDVLAQDRRS